MQTLVIKPTSKPNSYIGVSNKVKQKHREDIVRF